jgi:hypothetical protein
MRFDNDYFLEDNLDIFVIERCKIIVTYDTLFHQSLEKYLNGKNLLIHGRKLNFSQMYDYKSWYQFTNCKIANIVNYGNFITYIIDSESVVSDGDSLHVKRKIKIKSLLNTHNILNH